MEKILVLPFSRLTEGETFGIRILEVIPVRLSEWMSLEIISQTELAKRLGVSDAMVSLVLAKKRRFSPDVARKIVEGSRGKVSLEELLFQADYEDNPND